MRKSKRAHRKTRFSRRKKQEFANILRKNMTPAEMSVWRELKTRQHLVGVNFKPQVIVEGYIPDFAELKARVLVEIDGAVHDSAAHKKKDMVRQGHLEKYGYLVLRYSNAEALKYPEAVTSAILHRVSNRLPGR